MALNKNTLAYQHKIQYIKQYNKTHYVGLILHLSKTEDQDILELAVAKKGKFNTFVKKAIRDEANFEKDRSEEQHHSKK